MYSLQLEDRRAPSDYTVLQRIMGHTQWCLTSDVWWWLNMAKSSGAVWAETVLQVCPRTSDHVSIRKHWAEAEKSQKALLQEAVTLQARLWFFFSMFRWSDETVMSQRRWQTEHSMIETFQIREQSWNQRHRITVGQTTQTRARSL